MRRRLVLLAALPRLPRPVPRNKPPARAADGRRLLHGGQRAPGCAGAAGRSRGGRDGAGERPAVVHVRGLRRADTGSAAFNRSLAQTRAQAVADALVTAAVSRRARILMEWRGMERPMPDVPRESRRVDIVIGG